MKETGILLKKQREELGLSIAEVSRSLKIKPLTIKKIESGLIDEMPNKPFVRGFVKSYASFLKLDASSVVKMLDLEMGGKQKNKDIEEKAHDSGSWFRKVRTKKQPKNKSLMVFLVICVVALFAANYSFKYLNQTASTATPDVVPPNEPGPNKGKSEVTSTPPRIKPTVTSATRKPLKSKTVKEVISDIESAKKTSDKVTYQLGRDGSSMLFAKPLKDTQIPFADPLANPAASVRAAFNLKKQKANTTNTSTIKKTKVLPAPKKEPAQKVAVKKTVIKRPSAPIFKQELRLYTTKATKIVFQIDKDIKRTISLDKGQTHRLKAFDKVWLSLEDAGSVFIFHNKKDLGKAGNSGESKEIVFDN